MTSDSHPDHAPEEHGLGPVRGGWLLVLVVVVLVAAVALWRAFTDGGGPEADTPTASETTVSLPESAQRQAGISTEAVRQMIRADGVEAPGILALDEKRTARLGSLVEGVVIHTTAEVGDRVRPGQVLAEMHSHVVHDVWADHRKAVADHRRQETELAFARQAEERAVRLLEAKAISRQALQRAEVNRVAAEARLDMAKTEERRAEEALDHYGVTNAEDPSGEYIPVRSPLNGVVRSPSARRSSSWPTSRSSGPWPRSTRPSCRW